MYEAVRSFACGRHEFFCNVQWDSLRSPLHVPYVPFLPDVASSTDARHFNVLEPSPDELDPEPIEPSSSHPHDALFSGFHYRSSSLENTKSLPGHCTSVPEGDYDVLERSSGLSGKVIPSLRQVGYCRSQSNGSSQFSRSFLQVDVINQPTADNPLQWFSCGMCRVLRDCWQKQRAPQPFRGETARGKISNTDVTFISRGHHEFPQAVANDCAFGSTTHLSVETLPLEGPSTAGNSVLITCTDTSLVAAADPNQTEISQRL